MPFLTTLLKTVGCACVVCGTIALVVGTGGLCASCITANLTLAKVSGMAITGGVAASGGGTVMMEKGYEIEKKYGKGS